MLDKIRDFFIGNHVSVRVPDTPPDYAKTDVDARMVSRFVKDSVLIERRIVELAEQVHGEEILSHIQFDPEGANFTLSFKCRRGYHMSQYYPTYALYQRDWERRQEAENEARREDSRRAEYEQLKKEFG